MLKMGRKPKLDPAYVREVADKGQYSCKELSDMLGVSDNSMRDFLNEHDIPYKRRQTGTGASLSDEQKARIEVLYKAGIPVSAIGGEVGCGRSTVLAYLGSQGITRERGVGVSYALRERYRKKREAPPPPPPEPKPVNPWKELIDKWVSLTSEELT